ncbi:uncharacterized protein LOC126858165 isoform X2 [Cataglyphis hispanica]|uniref:uncharacterized protein LOC126858165 isoform X2 n=1 Tax=Cataglyphis hispanica TaxID=1086592 RepID=UPI00217F8BBD|nr:uncharacterized protein LOC126858165 isoform X2 [Cataglyphis hispanica]
MNHENIPLCWRDANSGLSLFFATLCIVDIFGVFPIIALPRSIVQCASQNLHLFGLKLSGQRFDFSFCYWLLIVGVLLCPLMWLGSPRDMKWVATCSSITVILTAILVWWSIITDDRTSSNFAPVVTSPTWDKFISGYGMLAFQFDVHPTLMTIQVDMRQPGDIDRAIFFSFLTSGSLFALTACLAVWKYGDNTTANILEAMPSGSIADIAILLAALQLCFSSVIGYSALFQHLEDHWNVRRTFGWKRCAMRSAVVLLSVAVGESVSRFDIVMALIGGSLTGSLVFVLPPLIYSRMLVLKDRSIRTSNIERKIFMSSRKKCNNEEQCSTDSRAHSRSIYYGFLSATNNPHSYAYLYFDDLDEETNSYSSEFIDCYEDEGEKKDTIQIPMISTLREDQPLLIDAAEPTTSQITKSIDNLQQGITEMTADKKKLWTFEKMINYLGCFIITIGIAITLSSTYVNIWNTIRYVRFTPPCIINATVNRVSVS